MNTHKIKMSRKFAEDLEGPHFVCSHYWIPNSGRGGEPEFRTNRQMSTEPIMHVMCSLCSTRTWFTEKQWHAIPVKSEPKGVFAVMPEAIHNPALVPGNYPEQPKEIDG